ncbi:MAG: hypothetical protein ACR2HF_01400 [Methylococcaceae bacterium]
MNHDINNQRLSFGQPSGEHNIMINTISKFLAVSLLVGTSFGAVAAESAGGVAEHMNMLIETTKAAQTAAASGDKGACLSSIKQAKQHYKELTGEPAGKPMQDAIKIMKDAQVDCESDKTADAVAKLSDVTARIQKVQASLK